ncbi:hypothetical protein AC578_9121 [Pseudocercospora eumusae]|uniref:Uncharacterized protein n=1 Tax=Pseudocercospora eumusae TaxID=321146 RepID=A0A139HV45_9PEZI|nr:hypothetical protein AC578_9121 [Pseudocercospora eumusae]
MARHFRSSTRILKQASTNLDPLKCVANTRKQNLKKFSSMPTTCKAFVTIQVLRAQGQFSDSLLHCINTAASMPTPSSPASLAPFLASLFHRAQDASPTITAPPSSPAWQALASSSLRLSGTSSLQESPAQATKISVADPSILEECL